MIRLLLRIGLVITILAVGLAAGLGYGHLQLGKEQQAHQNKINEINRKIALLQKKASDERDARSGADGRNRAFQAEVERLGKENGEKAELIKKFEAQSQSFEAKLKGAAEEAARLNAARNEVSAQLAQVLQAAKELEGQAKLLAAGKQTLETSLAKVNLDLDNCRNHNAKLCIIADDMFTKQKSRSALGSLVQNEPVTQIGKVELERLTHEYKDKIEQEKIRNK